MTTSGGLLKVACVVLRYDLRHIGTLVFRQGKSLRDAGHVRKFPREK